MKPRPDHEAKVRDAINVLKSRGVAHYRPDIAAYTGLAEGIIDGVLRYWENQAVNKPRGKITVPWSEMKGKLGGIALTPVERRKAAIQRDTSLQSQLERHELRTKTEYLREAINAEWAMAWALGALRVGRDTFKDARKTIDLKHLEALIASKMDLAEAVEQHAELMDRIDRL